jgi:hypothetical protein
MSCFTSFWWAETKSTWYTIPAPDEDWWWWVCGAVGGMVGRENLVKCRFLAEAAAVRIRRRIASGIVLYTISGSTLTNTNCLTTNCDVTWLDLGICSSRSYITTDCQSASLSWCQAPIWDSQPLFLLPSLINFTGLLMWGGAPSPTIGRVCSFQLLLGIASAAFLGSESRGSHEHIL